MKPDNTRGRAGYVFILIFGLLAAGVVSGSAYLYRNYKQNFRVEVERRLSGVAGLKVDYLVRMRQEWLRSRSPFSIRMCFLSPGKMLLFEYPQDQEAGNQLRMWLSHIQSAHQYDRVILLDSHYNKKVIMPDRPERSTAYVSASSLRRPAVREDRH